MTRSKRPSPSRKQPPQGRNPANPPAPPSQSDVLARLDRKLLGIGGERVARWPVTDRRAADQLAAELLARGQLFNLPVKRRRGEPNRCHTNAAAIWGHDVERYSLVTGYALSGGVWREHSWVVDAKRLYETTRVAEAYFGMILDRREAIRFWWANYLSERYPGPLSLFPLLVSPAAKQDSTEAGEPAHSSTSSPAAGSFDEGSSQSCGLI